MKRINVMLYTEVLDSLESLSNEEIGRMFRLIIKWNKGEVVEPTDSLEKFVWATLLPKLEKDKETYLQTSEKRRDAVNKRWNKQKDTNVYKSIQMNTNSSSSSNSINSSKEELINIEQPSSPLGDEVVSKGLSALEKIFPTGKNYVGMDEVLLWEKLTQLEKKTMIKRASLYIREEKKKSDGMYIKKMGKWMSEQIEKGLEQQTPSMNNSTKLDDPRLLKFTDGTIYSFILDNVKSTGKADKIYSEHNRKDLYSTKEEMLKGLFDFFDNKN